MKILMIYRLLGCLTLLSSATLAAAETRDPVFNVDALLSTPLNSKTLDTQESKGIITEKVMFHSEMDGDKSVDIFAILAYPKGAKNLPAFIWNQGGLGQADANIITHYGAQRGYVGLCIDFPMPNYRSTGGYNIVESPTSQADFKKSPIYHGAVALLKAVSFLQSRPEVDKEKIGMCGSSWGGFFTTLMMGVDPRLKVGAAMFGCGFLDSGNAWWGAVGNPRFKSADELKHWMDTLDPGPRLARSTSPIGWFTGTNDMFYWMPALMRSYDAAAGPKHLTIFPNWAHALPAEGDEAVFAFLDAHLLAKTPLLEITPLKINSHDTIESPGRLVTVRWGFNGARKVKSADLILSYGDDGNWLSRYWKTFPATLFANNEAEVQLPFSPVPYYISGAVVDADGLRTSTPLARVDVKSLGLLDPKAKLDYDGAEMWGGFEPEQISWSSRSAFVNQPVSTDAHSGKQSIVLTAGKDGKPGTTRLYPLYFTVGVPHQLKMFLKSDKPVEIDVTLRGNFDNVASEKTKKVTIGAAWTEVNIDTDIPTATTASMSVDVSIPTGATALLDDVSFRPSP